MAINKEINGYSNRSCTYGNWNFRNWKLNSKMGKLESQKLGIEFGNQNFEELFKDENFKSK